MHERRKTEQLKLRLLEPVTKIERDILNRQYEQSLVEDSFDDDENNDFEESGEYQNNRPESNEEFNDV